jgi:hypothetical protein
MYSSNQQYGELCRIMMLLKLRLSELKKLGGKLRRGQRQRGIGLKRIRMIARMIVSMIIRVLSGARGLEACDTDNRAGEACIYCEISRDKIGMRKFGRRIR